MKRKIIINLSIGILILLIYILGKYSGVESLLLKPSIKHKQEQFLLSVNSLLLEDSNPRVNILSRVHGYVIVSYADKHAQDINVNTAEKKYISEIIKSGYIEKSPNFYCKEKESIKFDVLPDSGRRVITWFYPADECP